MAVTDHGNFDLTLEATEELLTTALLAQVKAPKVPSTEMTTTLYGAQFTMRPELKVSVVRADCRGGGAATVALLGTVSGNLFVKNAPVPLPSDAKRRRIKIDSSFAVVTKPKVGTVAGTRGLVFPIATAAVEVRLDGKAVDASYPVKTILMLAHIYGGDAAVQQIRAQIHTLIIAALEDGLRQGMATRGDVLALREPNRVSFRVVLTTDATLKLLTTIVAPDGDPALVSGLTVRRNNVGGPLDQCVIAVSNAHVLGSAVFPAVTTALGIPGTPSLPQHPCLLLGGPALPGATFGVPTIPVGPVNVPAATLSVVMLLGQIDGLGIRVDLVVRAVTLGGFATITMNGTLTAKPTAAVKDGALTIGLGAPSVATTTTISVSPWVFAAGLVSGGAVTRALDAAVTRFAGAFLDNFVRTNIVPALTASPLPSVSLPLPGPFSGLTANPVQTTEATAPPRLLVLLGTTIPLDRVNDVFVRLL